MASNCPASCKLCPGEEETKRALNAKLRNQAIVNARAHRSPPPPPPPLLPDQQAPWICAALKVSADALSSNGGCSAAGLDLYGDTALGKEAHARNTRAETGNTILNAVRDGRTHGQVKSTPLSPQQTPTSTGPGALFCAFWSVLPLNAQGGQPSNFAPPPPLISLLCDPKSPPEPPPPSSPPLIVLGHALPHRHRSLALPRTGPCTCTGQVPRDRAQRPQGRVRRHGAQTSEYSWFGLDLGLIFLDICLILTAFLGGSCAVRHPLNPHPQNTQNKRDPVLRKNKQTTCCAANPPPPGKKGQAHYTSRYFKKERTSLAMFRM